MKFTLCCWCQVSSDAKAINIILSTEITSKFLLFNELLLLTAKFKPMTLHNNFTLLTFFRIWGKIVVFVNYICTYKFYR